VLSQRKASTTLMRSRATPCRLVATSSAGKVGDHGKDGQLLQDHDDALIVKHIEIHRLLRGLCGFCVPP